MLAADRHIRHPGPVDLAIQRKQTLILNVSLAFPWPAARTGQPLAFALGVRYPADYSALCPLGQRVLTTGCGSDTTDAVLNIAVQTLFQPHRKPKQ
jgi:hypothetical protein